MTAADPIQQPVAIAALKDLLDAWDAEVAAGTPADDLIFDDLDVRISAAERQLGIDHLTGNIEG